MHKFLLSLFLPFFLVSCTGVPVLSSDRQGALSALLQGLDENISALEAKTLSKEIIYQVDKLRQKFEPVAEPHFNNFLINAGVKKEGLCYQWSDALYLHFSQQNYRHFDFHLLVADKGKYFSEHNVMVVTAKEGNAMEGIIIDPWRNPGSLYFSKVKEDRVYEWKWRKTRELQ